MAAPQPSGRAGGTVGRVPKKSLEFFDSACFNRLILGCVLVAQSPFDRDALSDHDRFKLETIMVSMF
jgi:hypothetical protein